MTRYVTGHMTIKAPNLTPYSVGFLNREDGSAGTPDLLGALERPLSPQFLPTLPSKYATAGCWTLFLVAQPTTIVCGPCQFCFVCVCPSTSPLAGRPLQLPPLPSQKR